ncbi:MAG TPA: hypothetical protein VJ797_15670 [Burkholderiales bacterium]|nr:hypothetical protein [Burkholderiales bacterium]
MAPKEKREPRALSQVKIILRDNFRALLDRDYPRDQYKNGRGQLQAFIRDHKRAGWSATNLSKLQRVRDEGSTNLDTVANLAMTYHFEAYQLFVRNLEVNDPQQAVRSEVVRMIDQLEKARRGQRETD